MTAAVNTLYKSPHVLQHVPVRSMFYLASNTCSHAVNLCFMFTPPYSIPQIRNNSRLWKHPGHPWLKMLIVYTDVRT